MAVVTSAFVAALGLGVCGGVLCALTGLIGGVRPRRPLRDHRRAAEGAAIAVGTAGLLITGAAITQTSELQLALGLSCAAAAALFGLATWVLVVEPDEDGDAEGARDPRWWPEFERELLAWSRARRTPTAPRS